MNTSVNRIPMRIGISAIILAWFILMVQLGTTDFFYTHKHVLGLSSVQQAIVGPILIFLAAFLLLTPFANFIRTANLTFMVALQGVRILALSHIVSWGYGLMAGGFALPVAIGNLIVCVLALASIVSVAERRSGWRVRTYALSIVGLLEFFMTIALAVLGLFTRPLDIDPGVASGGYVSFATAPLSLFPTFAIPALMITHLVTLIALRHQR